MNFFSFLLLSYLLVAPVAQAEKLWPPRGNNRPLIAATQALWWDKDDPEARKLKARALDFAGRYAEAEKAARHALLVSPPPTWSQVEKKFSFEISKVRFLPQPPSAQGTSPPMPFYCKPLPNLKTFSLWQRATLLLMNR